jgi:hypothetical protein
VSTNERLVPHLATRREVYIFPVLGELSAYVLERDAVVARASLPAHRPVARAGGFVLLRRGG